MVPRTLASLRTESEIGNSYAAILTHTALTNTHFTQRLCIGEVLPRAALTYRLILTVEDLDGDRLFLLDGLCVRETGVADVVISGVLAQNI